MLLIGYDIGSSSIKVALVDSQTKKTVAKAQYPEVEMPMITHQEGWAEQNPEDWWENAKKATDILFAKSGANRAEVEAIGIAYQMHGLVVLDEEGQVLRPSIIWCDSRAVAIGDKAFQDIGQDKCLSSLLNSPGNFTASKLKWVKDNEPEIYSKVVKMMLPGDYIAYKFTDKICSTPSSLSEGILWDFQKNEVSQTLLDYYGFDKTLIPEVVPVFSNQGQISPAIAKEFGFSEKAVVAYRSGDQPNNAFSLNVTEPGEIAATGGTSGVVYGVVDKLRFDPKNRVNTFAHVTHSVDELRLGILLCVNGTGSAYSWLKNNLAKELDYFQLEKLADSVAVGSQGLSFLPFGNGSERMLGNQLLGAEYRNLQFNIHSLAHMTRSCLEGIAFSFVYGIECMNEMGLKPQVIKAGNDNMFQSAIFSQTIANLANVEIQLKETSGAVGAALGAGVGCGFYASPADAFDEEVVLKKYTPQKESKLLYEEAYKKWKSYLKN